MTNLSVSMRRTARMLRFVTLGAILLVEALVLLAAWAVVAGRRADLPALRIEDQGLAAWPAAISLLLIGLLVGLALFRLARMLGKVEGGAPFGAARDLRGFAFYLFLTVLVSVLAPIVAPLLAGGPMRLQLSLSLGELLMLLITGLLFFVARLLDEAQAIADDASQIV
jgi:hypothetical protein